jgi:hypothetical protein
MSRPKQTVHDRTAGQQLAAILGIPQDRLVLLVGRGVREYDRDHRDPSRVEVKTHSPGSRLAREAHRVASERDKREGHARPVARQYDDAAAIYRLNGDGRRASYCANMAEHIRAGIVIAHAPGARTVAPLRPQAPATPRARERRDSSSSRSSGQDPGDDDGPSNPFGRDVDRLLRGLRVMAREYELERVYEPIPGSGHEPDRWKALCPVHPGVERYTLLITELPGGRADVCCSVGCSAASIRYILLGDRERERRAEAYAQVIVWAQQYGKRRAA